MAEELEAVRERSALLHEQLTDLRTEQIDQRSLIVALIALIFLPLTFVTGLFGMNVEGIPIRSDGMAFWWIAIGSCVFGAALRSEEHTSELQSLMRISYAVFCLKKKK